MIQSFSTPHDWRIITRQRLEKEALEQVKVAQNYGFGCDNVGYSSIR
ncbi:hypothetical protein [Planktotalea sp.]